MKILQVKSPAARAYDAAACHRSCDGASECFTAEAFGFSLHLDMLHKS